jgi:hypothetical protein
LQDRTRLYPPDIHACKISKYRGYKPLDVAGGVTGSVAGVAVDAGAAAGTDAGGGGGVS